MTHLSLPLRPADRVHLAWRSGFGPHFRDPFRATTRQQAIDRVFRDARTTTDIQRFKWQPRKDQRIKNLPPELRRKARQARRQEIKELGHLWLHQMASDPAQLREKMTFFWHDHFAARVEHPYGLQDFNNLMRRHATGNFRNLLIDVAQHPVMLEYLNGRQNRKAHPNENFARELMELFTLGVGHYSETDIKEAARAFTGWNFDAEGQFVIRKRQHDAGTKTFRGMTGNFDGVDIIDQLLADKQTARYLAAKFYAFFVHPEPHSPRIEALATTFYEANYEIEPVLRAIFSAEWFWDPAIRGTRIKSPVELLAGLQRNLPLEFPDADATFPLLKVLGQVPFDPPNVAGWPAGEAWIDASTLSIRLTLPAVALLQETGQWKANPDLMMGEKPPKQLKKLKAEMDWRAWKGVVKGQMAGEMASDLIARTLPLEGGNIREKVLAGRSWGNEPGIRLRQLTLGLLQLPEYQLA